MHVFKFGGSCLTGPDSLERVRGIVEATGLPVVCVFSALKGVTDRLIALAHAALDGAADPEPLIAEHLAYLDRVGPARAEAARARLDALFDELRRTLKGIEYLREVSLRSLDRVMSVGERAAVVLAEALLDERGLPVEAAPDADPGFVSDGVHGDARIRPGGERALRERYAAPRVHLVPGFVARAADGAVTTLGRGGSDYSATYLGAALGATTTLWKDTTGLLTADPKIVAAPRRLERLHYLDALELAHYGTEAIAEKALLPAMEAGTAIEIRSFAEPDVVTRVDGEEADVLAITCVRRAAMIELEGHHGDMLRTLARLFEALADMRIYPLLVTEASPRGETSIIVKAGDLPRLERWFEERGAGERPAGERPTIRRDLGLVAMIGSHMRGRVGMAASIFQCLAACSINIVAIAQTASERNVSVAVVRASAEDAVRALHARFVEGRPAA